MRIFDSCYADNFDNFFAYMKKRYAEYDRMIAELDEAPKQLDLFTDQ